MEVDFVQNAPDFPILRMPFVHIYCHNCVRVLLCACWTIDSKMLCTHLYNLVYCSLTIQCNWMCYPYIRLAFYLVYKNCLLLLFVITRGCLLIQRLLFLTPLFYSLSLFCFVLQFHRIYPGHIQRYELLLGKVGRVPIHIQIHAYCIRFTALFKMGWFLSTILLLGTMW